MHVGHVEDGVLDPYPGHRAALFDHLRSGHGPGGELDCPERCALDFAAGPADLVAIAADEIEEDLAGSRGRCIC